MPQHILDGLHAPPQNQDIPLIEPDLLTQYDGFLCGVPTRYGNYPAQWKTFIDQTGHLWLKNALCGKYFGLFISTATMGGGQESTALAALSTWIHHGMIFVPLAGPSVSKILGDLSEVRGGSPWGAGTFSSGDGSRHPTAKELELARIQGHSFYRTVHKVYSPT